MVDRLRRKLRRAIMRLFGVCEGVRVGGRFEAVCKSPDGKEKWRAPIKNLVPNGLLDYLLECLFESGTSAFVALDPWYVGLTDGTPTPAAGDTMATHAGWVEVTAYDEATRQEFVNGAISGQSVSNSASKAAYTISADSTTIGGAFISSSSTKGGSVGTLLCVGPFTVGDKSADDGDTLEVQYTFSAADDGV